MKVITVFMLSFDIVLYWIWNQSQSSPNWKHTGLMRGSLNVVTTLTYSIDKYPLAMKHCYGKSTIVYIIIVIIIIICTMMRIYIYIEWIFLCIFLIHCYIYIGDFHLLCLITWGIRSSVALLCWVDLGGQLGGDTDGMGQTWETLKGGLEVPKEWPKPVGFHVFFITFQGLKCWSIPMANRDGLSGLTPSSKGYPYQSSL